MSPRAWGARWPASLPGRSDRGGDRPHRGDGRSGEHERFGRRGIQCLTEQDEAAVAATRAALRDGFDVVVQGTLVRDAELPGAAIIVAIVPCWAR